MDGGRRGKQPVRAAQDEVSWENRLLPEVLGKHRLHCLSEARCVQHRPSTGVGFARVGRKCFRARCSNSIGQRKQGLSGAPPMWWEPTLS